MCNGINAVMIRLEKKVLAAVRGIERCQFVNNYGMVQYELGYPGTDIPTWLLSPWAGACKHEPHWDPTGVDAFRFGPHAVPMPGQLADNYIPFEGGDPTFMKSPWAGLLYYTNQWDELIRSYGLDPAVLGINNMGPIDDWIHLSKLGNKIVVNHCFDVCVENWLADYPHPQVVSVERSSRRPIFSGQVFDPTNLHEVTFTVTFNEPVTGVDEGDFVPVMHGGLVGARVEDVEEAKDGATYTVTVSTGSGTLALAVRDNDTIKNAQGHSLWGTGQSMDWAPGIPYHIDPAAGVPIVAWPLAIALLGAGAATLRRSRRSK